MTCFKVFIKILHGNTAKVWKFPVDMSTWWMDNQPVKMVSVGTMLLCILVGILPTMDSVKNGFKSHL